MGTQATYDELIARLRTLMISGRAVPVVGVSGHGGAGKSNLADDVARSLGLDPEQAVVGTDEFYLLTCGPEAGLWEQHDWAQIGSVVRQAQAGAARLRYDYRWWSGNTGVVDREMPPILIVEGIRLFRDLTSDWFDLSVWIDMGPDEAGLRAVARNAAQGDDDAELDLWQTKWIPEGRDYEGVERPRERADMVLAPRVCALDRPTRREPSALDPAPSEWLNYIL